MVTVLSVPSKAKKYCTGAPIKKAQDEKLHEQKHTGGVKEHYTYRKSKTTNRVQQLPRYSVTRYHVMSFLGQFVLSAEAHRVTRGAKHRQDNHEEAGLLTLGLKHKVSFCALRVSKIVIG